MGNNEKIKTWNKVKLIILGGCLGGITISLIAFVIIVCAYNPFKEKVVYLEYNPSFVQQSDSSICKEKSYNVLLDELKSKKVIITPQEYTSHLGSYYQSLIAVLVCLFVVFTLVSLFTIKGIAQNEARESQLELDKRESRINNNVITYIKDSLKDLLSDSVYMQNVIKQTITGQAQDILKEEFSSMPNAETIVELQEKVDSFECKLDESLDTIFEILEETHDNNNQVE
ncbi:MAG: hypothetical protein GX963_06735 [Bacteroidales bacterium]|nr:hypothetical protein [Bacteroidales bacterium]